MMIMFIKFGFGITRPHTAIVISRFAHQNPSSVCQDDCKMSTKPFYDYVQFVSIEAVGRNVHVLQSVIKGLRTHIFRGVAWGGKATLHPTFVGGVKPIELYTLAVQMHSKPHV